MLKDKIDTKDKRHKMVQKFEKDIDDGRDEGVWEGIVDREFASEGIKVEKRNGEGTWVEEPLRARERLKFLIWEDLHRAKKMGDRMIEALGREQELWREERDQRRTARKAAKKGKRGEESG